MNYSTFPRNHYPFSPSPCESQPYRAPRTNRTYKPRQRGVASEKRIPNYLHVCIARAQSTVNIPKFLVEGLINDLRFALSPSDAANLN